MFLEHLVIGLGIALWCSLFLNRRIDFVSGLIVLGSCLPDIDGIIDIIQYPLDFSTTLLPSLVAHNRYIHSVGGLVIVSLLAGVILFRLGQPLGVSAAATGIGFTAHLIEDALAYNPAAAFFWPLSAQKSGLGVFTEYSRDFLGIANAEVLLLSTLFLLTAILPWIALYVIRRSKGSETADHIMG